MILWRLSIFLVLLVSQCFSYELNILHINDAHAHIDGTSRKSGLCRDGSSCYGGFARVVSKVKELKEKLPNVIFLHAGDMFTGTPYFSSYKSDVLVDFINEMKFDAQALGNHEFDEGVPELAKYLRRLSAPVVCCNVDVSDEPRINSSNIVNSLVLDTGEVKIGVVGFVTTDVNLRLKGKVIIRPEIPSLNESVAEVRRKGAQLVIALGHSGYEPEMQIASEVEGIDVVVGGHSHTFLYSGELPSDDLDKPIGPYPTVVTQITGKKVLVVQAFQFAKYLGHLKLEFDSGHRLVNVSGNPILLKPSFPRDERIMEIQEKWDRNITETCEVAGEFTDDMDGDRSDCRFRECPMGDFVADAIRDYARRQLNITDVISFLHGGIIRSSIEKGKATVGEVSSVMPFSDPIVVVHLTGSTLLEALEFSVKDYSPFVGTPRFVQTAGMRVKFDLGKPAGARLVEFQILQGMNGTATNVTGSATYVVAMSRFTYRGGDGFKMFNNSTVLHKSMQAPKRILLDYLKRTSPYELKKEPRVEVAKV